MTIKKAIFPVGGLGTRFLPATKAMPKEMLPVVDKPLIQYAVEEAVAAGIEQFIFVTGRNKTAIEDHFDHSFELESTLSAKNKQQALGTVLLLADDLILGAPAMAEMTSAYTGGNMVALMDVPASDTGAYGIITPGSKQGNLTEITGIVEKPSPDKAPSGKAVVGRYILEPKIFDELRKGRRGAGGEIQLTDALAARIGHAPFHGLNFSGERFDCGSKIGFLKANIAFGLTRDELQGDLSQWLATRL
ncbi:MAG: UTP--glucose-1-phosphate uridylyltransferase [Proteobacteria bacterium]|nr:UTP--glucose-1-phosphate uridylyltransferase [Pseudomonadota bacterium]